MCHFLSWIVNKGELQFLTANDIFNTKRGRALQKHCGDSSDYVGHGAIEFFTETSGGEHFECEDFSSPKNFPEAIVAAVKAGAFAGLGCPEGLLNKKSQAEYNKVRGAALAECDKVRGAALAECYKVCNAAWAECDKVRIAAWAEYYKVCGAAWAEYNKACDEVFWKLFADKKNRAKAWK